MVGRKYFQQGKFGGLLFVADTIMELPNPSIILISHIFTCYYYPFLLSFINLEFTKFKKYIFASVRKLQLYLEETAIFKMFGLSFQCRTKVSQ